jgi:hypothetical protein
MTSDPDADLHLLRQRVAARLPDVRGLTIESEEHPPGCLYITGAHKGATFDLRMVPDGTIDTATVIAMGLACEFDRIPEQRPVRLLPEVVLQEETVVTLNGHSLRLAEQQRVVRAEPRATAPVSTTYTEEMAHRDVERLSGLMSLEVGDTERDRHALLVLSKLHCFRLGAPADTEGHRWARAQYEATQDEEIQREADEAAVERGKDPLNGRHFARQAGHTAYGTTPAEALAGLRETQAEAEMLADWTRIPDSTDDAPKWERLEGGRRRAFAERHDSDLLPGRATYTWRTYDPNGAQRDHGDARTWDEMVEQVAYDLGREVSGKPDTARVEEVAVLHEDDGEVEP